MIDAQRPTARNRRGQTSPVVVTLLAGILIALTVLIVLFVNQRPRQTSESSENETTSTPDSDVVGDGEIVGPEPKPNPPPKPEPIGDPDRIRETAQAGKTYRSVVKAGFSARVEDKDWGVRQVTNLAFASELVVNRTIESNDGRKIVELRHFEQARTAKLLCEVEELTIDLGLPGVLILGVLDAYAPGSAETVLLAQPLAEALLASGSQALADDQASKAFAHVDSLEGKKVRITFVDGVGVESIQPVGCSLSEDERDFVFNTSVLSDYWIMPDLTIPVGGRWSVDGSHFIGFFDPSWRGTPTGTVTIVRDPDSAADEGRRAALRVERGVISLQASDKARRRVGSFEPRGHMRYSLNDGFVEIANMEGYLKIEEVSKDHLLFEAVFRTQPKLEIVYSCELR